MIWGVIFIKAFIRSIMLRSLLRNQTSKHQYETCNTKTNLKTHNTSRSHQYEIGNALKVYGTSSLHQLVVLPIYLHI